MKRFILGALIILSSAPVLAANYRATVIDVIDGDTIIISENGKEKTIHLANIDAPELDQPFGRQATEFTKKNTINQQVGILTKGRNTDGETLAEVLFSGGKNLNYRLVQKGLAWADGKTTTDIAKKLQKSAKQQKVGLWSQSNPIPPWKHRPKKEPAILKFAPALLAPGEQNEFTSQNPGTNTGGSVGTSRFAEINCREKWGSNYKMVSYCLKKQMEAKTSIMWSKADPAVRRQCSDKWGEDYRMVDYCMKRQSEAQTHLETIQVTDKGRRICENKWGEDYRMVEYCIEHLRFSERYLPH